MKQYWKRFVKWLRDLFKPKAETIEVAYVPESYKEEYKATKAYFDERQKAPRNRKKKPSKKMRNTYKL